MKRHLARFGAALLGAWLIALAEVRAQAVAVTATLDTNSVPLGGATTLRVYAQVRPGFRVLSERIFSWYVDLLNTNAAVAVGNYAALTRPTSDNDPLTSGGGFTQGSNCHGIHDTFLNRPGAGVQAPVELVRVPVSGVSLGRTRFVVQAGTGVTGLAADFLVATVGANDPLFGGDYAQATVELEVRSASLCEPVLRITLLPGGAQARVMFTPCPGRTHTLEHRTTVGRTTEWQAVTGAPHNSGEVTVDVTGAQDFFRLRVGP